LEGGNHKPPENGLLTGKLVHAVLPVRWSLAAPEGRGAVETACTYDIHPRGARLLSARKVNLGDVVLMERGRNKAICQVTWTAEPASPLRGQFTVRCLESTAPWDDELRQMEEEYQPVVLDESQRQATYGFIASDADRRRRPRFDVEGHAEVFEGTQRAEGEVLEISELGARISAIELLRPGVDFQLLLNVFDVTVALKAQVKHLADNLGMGVEFQEIRRGDRPLLTYVLSRLRTSKVEEFSQGTTQPLALAG
jgi:hypothetical protein